MDFEDIGGGYAKAGGNKVWFLGESVDTDGVITAGQARQLENIGNGYAITGSDDPVVFYMGAQIHINIEESSKAWVIDADWIRVGANCFLRRGEEYSRKQASRMGCKVGVYGEGPEGGGGNDGTSDGAGFLRPDEQNLGKYHNDRGKIYYK
jgi:hypothetical protein